MINFIFAWIKNIYKKLMHSTQEEFIIPTQEDLNAGHQHLLYIQELNMILSKMRSIALISDDNIKKWYDEYNMLQDIVQKMISNKSSANFIDRHCNITIPQNSNDESIQLLIQSAVSIALIYPHWSDEELVKCFSIKRN